MSSRSRFFRGLFRGLGDCNTAFQSCDVPVYAVDGGYQPQQNSAPIGTGGTMQQNCDPMYQSCPPGLTMCDPTMQTCPPIGTGGSPLPGHDTGTGGYTPQIDYGADGSIGGTQSPSPSNAISVVTEGATNFLSGTTFGLPTWLVVLAGGAILYKASKS